VDASNQRAKPVECAARAITKYGNIGAALSNVEAYT